MFVKYFKRGCIAAIIAISAASGASAGDILPVYKTTIKNLIAPGGLTQNASLDTTIQTKAQEKALIDAPPSLSAFIFTPTTAKPTAGYPTVVLVGGHTGIYTSGATQNDKGLYPKLSNRSKYWAQNLVSSGYKVVLTDDFGSYGFVQGFPGKSWNVRPAWASAANARPQYIYSYLEDLAVNTKDVNMAKVYLLGWSNGGTAVLSAIATKSAPIASKMTFTRGFANAMALYPACGLENRYKFSLNFANTYNVSKPLEIVNADPALDTEVTVTQCTQTLVPFVQSQGGAISSSVKLGAYHTFDANTTTANAIAGNVAARDFSLARALVNFKK